MIRDKLKAVVPVLLGASDLGASIIERGGWPTRGDAADAFQLAVLGLLVFLVPNLDAGTVTVREGDETGRPFPPPSIKEGG